MIYAFFQHIKLLTSVVAGAVLFFLLPSHWDTLTRVLVSMIFGIRPWDPAVLAGVSVLLAAVALMAAYLPSIRAAEVSPCESLRQ